MNQRLKRPIATLNSRRIAPLAAVAALVLALAWWRPWHSSTPAPPRPVALIPTPPTSTPTPSPAPIIPPTAPVYRPAATPATPRPATPAGQRAPGTVLFVGILAGREGIIAASADGSGQRLLVAGSYDAVAWSLTGDRFAAVGPLLSGFSAQVAIFDAEGHPLARYPFEGTVGGQLLWSPDGSKLACTVVPPVPRQPAQPAPTETWQIAMWGEVQRVAVPDTPSYVFPLGWTPAGLLAVVGGDSSQNRTLWTVSADGSHAVREVIGAPLPLALSPDGEILYALERPPTSSYNELVAVTLRTDARRVIADADRLGALASGMLTVPGTYTFSSFSAPQSSVLSPNGTHLAVVIERGPAASVPGLPPQPERTLILLWPDGTITGTLRLPDGVWPGRFAWSPDGTLLAFFASGVGATRFIVADTSGTVRASIPYSIGTLYGGAVASWSPDGRWIVYASLNGIGVVSLNGHPSYPLTTSGGFPAWRPR